MQKPADIEAAVREALGSEAPEGIRVRVAREGVRPLVTLDLPVEEDDAEGSLDAFVDAFRETLLRLAWQQGGGETRLGVVVRCGRYGWRSDQDARTGAVTEAKAGPGSAGSGRRAQGSTPVMTRLDAEAVAAIDLLVEAGVSRSRSEAVAWCVEQTLRREESRIQALREPVSAIRAARQALRGPAHSLAGRWSTAAAAISRNALREAKQRNQAEAGPEHLLLALLRERPNLAASALQNLGVDLADLEARADAAAGRGGPDEPAETDLSAACRKVVLDLAAQEALALGHVVQGAYPEKVGDAVEPEHLLLGLLRLALDAAGGGLAFLTEAVGTDLAKVRNEIARLRG